MLVQDAVIRLDRLTIDLIHRQMWMERNSTWNPTFATLETCCVLAEDASLPLSPDVVLPGESLKGFFLF